MIVQENERTVGVSAIAAIGKNRVAVGHDNGIVRLWLYSSERLQHLRNYIGGEKKILLIDSFSEEKFVSVDEDNKIRIWDIVTENCIRIFHRKSSYMVDSIAALPDNLLAVSSYYTPAWAYFEVWDLDFGERIHEGYAGCHRPGSMFLKTNAKGHLVVSGKFSNDIGVWQINRLNCTQVNVGDGDDMGKKYSLAVLPTGEIITGYDHLYLYKVSVDKGIYLFKEFENSNIIDAIHPVAGYKILTVDRQNSNGNTLKLWNCVTGTHEVLGNSRYQSEVFENHAVLENEGAVLSLGKNKIGIHRFSKNIFHFPKNLAEIRKTARVLSQAYRTKTSHFAVLPEEIAVKIAVLTSNNMNADEKEVSESIAWNYFSKPHS